MQQTTPIHELTAEHRVIEKAAALMEKMADELAAGSGVDGSDLQDLVQFLRVYADELHHGKEEAILFPATPTRTALIPTPVSLALAPCRRASAPTSTVKSCWPTMATGVIRALMLSTPPRCRPSGRNR